MRGCLLVIFIVLAGLGIAPAASAQSTGEESRAAITEEDRAAIEAILAQYPSGGPELRAAIARAVAMRPSLAPAVAVLAGAATLPQQQAMGAGLADAANFYAKLATDFAIAAVRQIEAAIALGPAAFVLAFNAIAGPAMASSLLAAQAAALAMLTTQTSALSPPAAQASTLSPPATDTSTPADTTSACVSPSEANSPSLAGLPPGARALAILRTCR